jgi:hypothetical protein
LPEYPVKTLIRKDNTMSNFGTINWADILKGFLLAAITAVITGIYQAIQTGGLPSMADLQTIGIVALGAGLSYLIKNLLTNSDGTPLKKEE